MKKKGTVKEILDWARYIAISLFLAFVINHAVIAQAKVVSSSMESTIMTGSRIIGSRLAYLIGQPERFDIILFRPPDDETSIPYVKRIIGLPHEKVEIIAGKVYINDSDTPLDDSFINEEAYGDYGPYTVPEGCYFVLGDNRNRSSDSKNWTNKFVPKGNIMSKILVEYFPTPKLFD